MESHAIRKTPLRRFSANRLKTAHMSEKSRSMRSRLCRWFDLDPDALERSAELLLLHDEEASAQPKSVMWLLVNFTHPYGGVFTVLRIADALERKGYRNRIVIYDNPSFDISPQLPLIRRYFPALSRESFLDVERPARRPAARRHRHRDLLGVGLSPYQLRVSCAKRPTSLQDFEAAFYPAGTAYALAENTYRLPLHRIFNTPGLQRFIESNYPLPGARSVSFTPAADARYNYAIRPLSTPVRVLFYARPGTPRNAYELTVAFARALKQKYGERVQLVAAGEKGSG